MTGFDIWTVIEASALVIGAILVVMQLRAGQKLGKAQYISQVNERLASFNDVIEDIFRLEKAGDFEALPKALQERILDYFTVFEVLEALRRNHVLKARDISYFFGGRFGELTAHSGVQSAVLYGPAGGSLSPMFSLHAALVAYRKRRQGRQRALATLGDLESLDPQVYRKRCSAELV